jgi:hypothetical protein
MTTPPRLYPQHQHHWADPQALTVPASVRAATGLVRCAVCGFEVPWRLANLDGVTAEQAPATDKGGAT